MEAVHYDNQKFVRRIQKYRECRLNKRVLLSKWAVIGKIIIKIKKIGISSTEKKKKSNAKEAAEENNDGVIPETKDSILSFPAVVSLPTTENIMKHETLNDAKEAPEENNEGMFAETKDSILNLPAVVSALTTDIMKHEVDEAAVRKDVAGGDDVTGDMEVVEAGDAEGNEEVKDLFKGESNVSGQEDKPTTEVITDDTEILDKGGGRKEKTVWMAGEGDYLI